MRKNNRANNELREVSITPHPSQHAEGSVMIKFGDTEVLCAASIEEGIPKWLKGKESGWVSAEYGMLPRSTHTRMRRDKAANSGRTQEISRLIARSLRAVVDMKALGEKQITVDCDVINADGGTRTAAITGGFVALCLAMKKLKDSGEITTMPIKNYLSAISVGLKDGVALLDLCYEEDCDIDTDMNFILTGDGNFVEIQGTAEKEPFSVAHLNQMIEVAQSGCEKLFSVQKALLEDILS